MAKLKINWDSNALKEKQARLFSFPKAKTESIATASLLSVLKSVVEFGNAFIKHVNGPQSKDMNQYLETYCEVSTASLDLACGADPSLTAKASKPAWGEHNCPDGALVFTRGKQQWTALVEVKVGTNCLDAEQIKSYHQIAQHYGFDCLITISNETGTVSGAPPASVTKTITKSQLKKIPIYHFQWRDLIGDAFALWRRDLESNVEDADQEWILGQWIKFLLAEKSDVRIQASLGDGWNEVLRQSKKDMLQKDSKVLKDVAIHWRGLANELAYEMRTLGIKLEPRWSRAEQDQTSLITQRLMQEAIKDGSLTLTWNCPDPIDKIHCVIELSSKSIMYYFEVKHFGGKTAGAKVMSWVSQIKSNKPEIDGVVIRPRWKKPYIETPFELKQCSSVNDLNSYLKTKGVSASTGEPSRLSIERHKTLHGSSGRQGRNHLEQIRDGMSEFYSQIVSGLRSVEVMPAQNKIPKDVICTEKSCELNATIENKSDN